VNRVFRDKPGGLVVDYLGLAHELKSAIATYTEGGGTGETAVDQSEAVAVMEEKYEICVADVRLPVGQVRGRARHHGLGLTFVVIVVVPLRTEAHDLVVELDTDPPAHADHHGLAVQGLEALLEVTHDVPGHEAQAFLGPDHSFELRHLVFEVLLALDLLALGDLLELLVDPRL
jgi:hypothetical protein